MVHRDMLLRLVILLVHVTLPSYAYWNDLQTTFRLLPKSSDKLPQNIDDARSQGWTHVSNGCKLPYGYIYGSPYTYTGSNRINKANYKFPGTRMLEPTNGISVPNKILMYNVDNGQVVGMQSLVPSKDFVGGKDCTFNKYYTKEGITYGKNKEITEEFCMTTMYFTDPAKICSGSMDQGDDIIYLRNGESYTVIPHLYADAKNDSSTWHMDKFFPGMGHHVTSQANRNDCNLLMPIQSLYAWNENRCRLIGFVWSHVNTKSKRGLSWEKPNDGKLGARAVLEDPAECILEAAKNGNVTTQHVYLYKSDGPISTTHCEFGKTVKQVKDSVGETMKKIKDYVGQVFA